MKETEYKLYCDNLESLELTGVYLLRNLDNKKLKIGSTENLNKRIKDIESNFRFCGIEPHLKAECFIEFKHNLELEKFLHKYLKQYNYMNEWFSIDDINIVLNEIKFFKDNDKIDFYTRDKYKNIYKQMIKQSEKENSFICDEWKEYKNFECWIHDNYYKYDEILRVNKDILFNNNEIYSPETCLFIPKEIHNLIQSECNIKQNNNGLFRFEHSISHWNINSNDYNIFNSGFIYATKEEAIINSKISKLNFLNELNDIYKDTIPTKIYNAVKKIIDYKQE